MDIFPAAQALAADLAGSSVDPNEAQKALAYLRSKREGKALFDYLQAIVNNGQAVVRSRQTLDYYRNLQAACQRHLRPLQSDYTQMVMTFAWSLRLLRYYRVVPQAAKEIAAERLQAPAQPAPQDDRGSMPASGTPARSAAPTLPKVGEIFAGRVSAMDESAVLVDVPGFDQSKASGVLKAEAIEGGRTDRYRVGNAARVEVTATRTLKSGRTILELKPAKRPEPTKT